MLIGCWSWRVEKSKLKPSANPPLSISPPSPWTEVAEGQEQGVVVPPPAYVEKIGGSGGPAWG